MKEIVLCPNCKRPTIKERYVYYSEEIKETSFEDYTKRIVEYEQNKNHHTFSGTLDFGSKKATQIIFECSTCGFTKVFDI